MTTPNTVTFTFDPDCVDSTARAAAFVHRTLTYLRLPEAMVDGEPSATLVKLMNDSERCLTMDGVPGTPGADPLPTNEPAETLDDVMAQIEQNGQSDAAAAQSAAPPCPPPPPEHLADPRTPEGLAKEVDSEGHPWISEIHIDSRQKYKEGNPTAGQFKRRKGTSAADVQAYFVARDGPPAAPLPEGAGAAPPPPPTPPAPPAKPEDVTAEMHALMIKLTSAGMSIDTIKASLLMQGIGLAELHSLGPDVHAKALVVLQGLEGQ